MPTFAKNKKAKYNFAILKIIECGIVLSGSEVKAIKDGKANLGESYVKIINNELWCVGMHIGQYSFSRLEHDPIRNRKLLVHKKELVNISKALEENGTTLIAVSLYEKNKKIKCEVAIAKGKKEFDKRETIKKRDTDREIERTIKNNLRK